MPIREAVRTSVLSKKWRFYYLTIPELVFDDQFCKELQDYAATQKKLRILSEYELELKYQFDEIVTKSLMLHPGRIVTFKACIPSFNSTKGPNVNKWILYLSRKNIKKLNLEYPKKDIVRHKLPPYFFSCLDLTYLKLRNFDVSPPPPECKGFLYLDQLVLIGIYFANNCFESILSGCPVLQRLELHLCPGIRHVNISGCKLKRLRIKAYDKFESISLENAPNLTEVSVMLDRIVTDSDKVVIGLEANPNSDLVKFVDSCPRVELLCLNGKFLQLLAQTPVPPKLSTSPDSLKILEFKGVNFMNFDEISAVVCLIRSAPNLQELYIEASTVKLNQEQVSGYLKLLDCSTFPLSKLHLVKLTNISAFDPEFEFIRFILFSSPSLATMSILQHPQLEVAEALEITKKLLLFRLSSAVSIEFSSDSKT
uniref:F-box/FBD/LRR-repeat protein At1g13570-like n=1 Tax=Nicotiana tabacum TaxID=4097 RepID=A0A1S4AUW2_TOBAC|nr:PREDICTED: F-box/FBD/LRR-repeat protein At1g13570-like [Nicotiana tabacum]